MRLGCDLFSRPIMLLYMPWLRLAIAVVTTAVLAGISSTVARSGDVDLTEVVRIRPQGPTWAIAWSPDGSRLTALVGNDVVTWTASSWIEERRYPVLRRFHTGQSLAYAEGGILAGAPDQIAPYNGLADAYVPAPALMLWNLTAGSPMRPFPPPTRGLPVAPNHAQDVFAVSDDGSHIAAVDLSDPLIFIYDTATGAILHAVPVPSIPRPPLPFEPATRPNPTIQETFSTVAFSPVGHTVGACGFSGRVYIIDAATGAVVRILPAYGEGVTCTAVAFSADGKLLATGRESRQYVPLGRQPRPADRLTLEGDTGNVRVWDAATGGLVASFPNAAGATRALSWSRSGSTLIAGDDGSLKRWTFQGTTVSDATSTPVPGGVFGTAFSPDGRLAVLREDGWIVIYR